MNNIYLVGFMGSGKSAVGRTLAKRLGRRFLDTDRLVERRAGKTVAEIFLKEGEAAFRRLERDAVTQASQGENTVCALGGGALLDRGNRARLSGSGTLVRLTCSERVLWRRLKPRLATRPLLAGGRRGFKALMRLRRGAYRGAYITVSTTLLSPAQVARIIACRLELAARKP